MGIYRRKDSLDWWISIIVVTEGVAKRVRKSAGTENKQQAQEYHDTLKAEAWKQSKLGEKPRYLWNDAAVRYLKEAELNGKASIESDRSAIRWLHPYLGGKFLDQITKSLMNSIIAAKKKPHTFTYKGTGQKRDFKPGVDTVNRMLATLRGVLHKARDEWEWIDKVPSISMLQGSVSRVRWITREEANRLISYLPPHLAAMCEFSLQTGLRRANVTHLKWSQIDLKEKTAWIESEDVKNRKNLAIPLSDKALSILQEWRGKSKDWVFPYKGKPVFQTGTKAWYTALEKARIDNFRWHDLRHTWASWHVQGGTPLHALQVLGGWSSYVMVLRYAHMGTDHLRGWVENMPIGIQVVSNGAVKDDCRRSIGVA